MLFVINTMIEIMLIGLITYMSEGEEKRKKWWCRYSCSFVVYFKFHRNLSSSEKREEEGRGEERLILFLSMSPSKTP